VIFPHRCEIRLAGSPRIRGVFPIGEDFIATIEILSIDPKINVGAQRAAVARADKILQPGSSACFRVNTLRVFGVLARNIDDAIDRIGAPKCATRPADDFDTINVLK